MVGNSNERKFWQACRNNFKDIMRRIIILLVLIAGGMSATAQNKNESKAEIKSSVICPMCQRTIEYDMTFQKGVKSVEVNLDNKIIEIYYNPKKTNVEELRKRITQIGYNADSLKRNNDAYRKLPDCCREEGMHSGGMQPKEH